MSRADYHALGIHQLTSQEERYVQLRARSVNPTAAARGAGYSRPAVTVAELSERPEIQRGIAYFREQSRQAAVTAGAIVFTKEDATVLYLEAHAKSITSTEEVKAIDSLVKLHGLATPERVEIEITRRDQLQELSDDELLEMSQQDIFLSPDQYVSHIED